MCSEFKTKNGVVGKIYGLFGHYNVFILCSRKRCCAQKHREISYCMLDMMAQMRDKMQNDFAKLDVEYDKENIWK